MTIGVEWPAGGVGGVWVKGVGERKRTNSRTWTVRDEKKKPEFVSSFKKLMCSGFACNYTDEAQPVVLRQHD